MGDLDSNDDTGGSRQVSSSWRSWGVVLTIALALAVALAAVLAWSGLTLRDAIAVSIVLAANIAAGGGLLAVFQRRRVSTAEVVGGGVAVALVWAMVVGLVLRSDAVTWLSLPVLAVVAAVVSAVRPGLLAVPRIDARPGVLAAGACASLVALALNRYQWERYRLTPPIDYTTFHPDSLFLQVVGTASHAAGSGTGGMSDWPLRYHWLSYAMSAGLESFTGSAAFAGMTRALPVVAIAGLAFLAAAWAARARAPLWVAWLAALLVVIGRFVGDLSIVPVNWDSLSQTVSGPILVLACFLAVYLPRRRPVLLVVVFTGVAFVLTGTKLSAGAVLVGAVVVLAVVAYLRGDPARRPTVAVVAACAAGAVAAFVLLESGQVDGGGLGLRDVRDPAALWTSLQPTVATTLALVPGWAGLIFVAARPVRQWSRATALGAGLAVGGLAPLWLMAESRPNNTWFLVSATTVVWVISAVGAGRAVRRSLSQARARRHVVVAAAVVAVGTAVVWAGAMRVSGGLAVTVVAQVVFLVILGVAVAVAAWLLRRRGYAGATVPLLVTAATMSAVTVVLANRLGVGSIGVPTSLGETATAWDGGEPLAPLSPDEIDALSQQLARVSHPGDVVAYDDRRITAALFAGRLVPYAAYGRLSTNLSVTGSAREFDARRLAVDGALAGDSPSVTTLCDDGVRWLVGPVDGEAPGLAGGSTVAAQASGFRIIGLGCGR